MNDVLVVIPAIKKNAIIPDQLIKKLNGITLIQRAIDTALRLVDSSKNLLILTDSDEIGLIAQRNNVAFKKDSLLSLNSENLIKEVLYRIREFQQENIFIYRANTPLIKHKSLCAAYLRFLELSDSNVLVSVKEEKRRVFSIDDGKLKDSNTDNLCEEVNAFYIFKKNIIDKQDYNKVPFFISNENSIEITDYQNWWVCEKILQRKRIVFHVFGSVKIGMGHISHSLSLAHEISDHEVVFVCNKKYELAVKEIASTDYRVIASENEEKEILDLNPDLVINDVLNTEKIFIQKLKESGVVVVNFEDLGSGAKYTDMTINELYDQPKFLCSNCLWGYEYLTLRDEFYTAKRNIFQERVQEVLIIFGGSDQNNLTLVALKSIGKICSDLKIKINIVIGLGYVWKDSLKEYIKTCDYDNIVIHFSTKTVSMIMEKCQLAISSNGRTVYELADMNIPSIVISHHKREDSHIFSTYEKGFINLGVVSKYTISEIEENFYKLVKDNTVREKLFVNIEKYNFRENKKMIVGKILDLL